MSGCEGPRLAWWEPSPPTHKEARSPPGSGPAVLVVRGEIGPADVSPVCERVRGLLAGSEADLVVCDVGGLARPDAAAVDVLARLQLAASRLGRRLLLRDARGELLDLVELMGLAGVLPGDPGSGLEPRRETEEREQGLGVEEEADANDRAVRDLEDLE
jgi:ABC-type transporter Mla MlaB component